jgi:hypothetical protein
MNFIEASRPGLFTLDRKHESVNRSGNEVDSWFYRQHRHSGSEDFILEIAISGQYHLISALLSISYIKKAAYRELTYNAAHS